MLADPGRRDRRRDQPRAPASPAPRGPGRRYARLMPASPVVRTVSDVMSHPVETALPSETIAEAAERMKARKVGSVVIVDHDRPIGILTERDLVRFAASGADASGTKVSEW